MKEESISNLLIEETLGQLLPSLARWHNYHDAQDLAQEAICNLLQHPDVDNPGGWAWRYANFLGMRLRRSKKREGEHRKALAKRSASRNATLDPIGELIIRERKEVFDAALANLKELERQLLELVNDFTYGEIANLLNFSGLAVKARLARARKKLRMYIISRLRDSSESI
jgi:RNA polymerase sigma factor (sigma-70 family)